MENSSTPVGRTVTEGCTVCRTAQWGRERGGGGGGGGGGRTTGQDTQTHHVLTRSLNTNTEACHMYVCKQMLHACVHTYIPMYVRIHRTPQWTHTCNGMYLYTCSTVCRGYVIVTCILYILYSPNAVVLYLIEDPYFTIGGRSGHPMSIVVKHQTIGLQGEVAQKRGRRGKGGAVCSS